MYQVLFSCDCNNVLKLLCKNLVILGIIALLHGCNSDDARESLHIAVTGQPNGVWWDTREKVLYISDEANNSLQRWSDKAGFMSSITLPTVDAATGGLGQMVTLANKQIFVTRFGFGVAGAVLQVDENGRSQIVQGLDTKLRRIGLTFDIQGNLFDCGFVRNADNTRTSSVYRLTLVAGSSPLAAQATEVISGAGKLVGCAISGETLYLTDQDNNQVLSVPLARLVTRQELKNLTVVAKINQPDLLAATNEGYLFTGGQGGVVFQVYTSGQVSEFAKGYRQVRGVAYDAESKRLFVIDRNPDNSAGAAPHLLHILPVY